MSITSISTFPYVLLGDSSVDNVTQSAYWVTSFGVELPWQGLDKNVCKFAGGMCGQTLTNVSYSYPIDILSYYPAVSNALHTFLPSLFKYL